VNIDIVIIVFLFGKHLQNINKLLTTNSKDTTKIEKGYVSFLKIQAETDTGNKSRDIIKKNFILNQS